AQRPGAQAGPARSSVAGGIGFHAPIRPAPRRSPAPRGCPVGASVAAAARLRSPGDGGTEPADDEDAMRYFTNDGPFRGPLLDGIWPEAIDVLETSDQSMPIGMALCVGRDAAGIALWTLHVHGTDVPGRWGVVDREFRPAHEETPTRGGDLGPGRDETTTAQRGRPFGAGSAVNSRESTRGRRRGPGRHPRAGLACARPGACRRR